ncbi:efflux RND transporter periplasmic adaptor subunit [Pedobacter sp. HMF7647]|uniref:Efflux RND transporter periplasmic adaptor subunit n=1 Tax=Hufsiella arboris TaxID=2695275 RepID=A0A7K1Y9C5_9SPHI|nr:efflux RND transporter periplasmic adaptor subunit [Hufsiella arboris]MXV50961.1 efflux RND transporter periplasmic adaptor subunit [Hufsiella arboris]
MKTKHIVYAIIIIAFGGLVAYRIIENKKSKEQQGRGPGAGAGPGKGSAPATMVSGVVIKPQRFSNTISVSGSIEANEQVQIRSEISGLVRAINFQEGSNVTKGQPLLRIDDSELRAQLSQAFTKQNLAGETEHRAKLLLEKEAISQEEYDTSLADLKALKAQTQLIQAQLAKTIVRAPFSGKIGLRAISVGEYLTPATAVANLVSIDPVKIQFAVPEKYSDRLKVNTQLTFTISGSQKHYKAIIYALEPIIDANTRTLQLKAKAPNPGGDLLPGSFAKVELPLATIENALLVPTQAVIPVLNGKQVFISNNGEAKQVMIETTVRTDSDVLVNSGLKPGDTVITTGLMGLKDKAPVKVKVKGH